MNRRVALAFLPGVLAACAVLPSAIPAATTASTAVALWGVAKGMGQAVLGAAEILSPGSASVVAGIEAMIAAAEPLVATAATSVTAAALLVQQANALTLAAAPLISVVAHG